VLGGVSLRQQSSIPVVSVWSNKAGVQFDEDDMALFLEAEKPHFQEQGR
jgi:hypothetical protein